MGELLEALHALQVIERQLSELRQQREARARRVEHHKRRAKKAEELLQQKLQTQQQRQIRIDSLQLDVTAREETVDNHRQALNKAKTNKEYAAILTAMNTEKADTSKIETEILQMMEEARLLKDEGLKMEIERAKLAEDVERAEETLSALDTKSAPKLKILEDQRDACAENISPVALSSFNRVARHHDGEALAHVSKLHPKREEYMCTGCNMKLTLEVVNILKTKDDLQICKVCGRILYLEEMHKEKTEA